MFVFDKPNGAGALLGLGDIVTPTTGYSLRYLSINYYGKPVIRVRKDVVGNPEQDFTPSQLTDGALAAFADGNDCFVSKWYDQFGSNDAVQTTAAEQPKIWDASTGLVTENGKPALDFDGVDDTLSLSSSLNIGGSPSIIGVLNTAAGDILWRAGGSDYWYVQASQIFRYRNGDFDETWLNTDGLPAMDGSQKLIATYKNTNSVLLTVDGVSLVTKTEAGGTGADGFFNNIGSDLLFMDGVWQELIIYNSDQSANRTKIEDNINAYYDIY